MKIGIWETLYIPPEHVDILILYRIGHNIRMGQGYRKGEQYKVFPGSWIRAELVQGWCGFGELLEPLMSKINEDRARAIQRGESAFWPSPDGGQGGGAGS